MIDSDKTIKIVVTVKNGAVIFPDDFNLNALRKEFHADLILGETDFADKNLFYLMAKESEAAFLPKGSRLLVNVSLKNVPAALKEKVIKDERPAGVDGGFVEIFLLEPLKLKLRGTKKAQLLDCPISIPTLPEQKAKSINHAYTLISQAFEPWRTSHTANVFSRVFWRENEEGNWRLLDVRREQAEAGELEIIKNVSESNNLFFDSK
ncbi:MAG: hypothetical protein M3Q99_09985 [Acidobacteriota bacterium]|nr:hypothetical protein [Acidobacteriota bacterium]